MTQANETAVLQLLELMSGEPVRAMEGAKGLLALPSHAVNASILVKVALDAGYRPWSRIGAVYALGLLPAGDGMSRASALRSVLQNVGESARLRGHAAEALGNLRDSRSTALLREKLMDTTEPLSVRRWCIYALAELDTREAKEALRDFAGTGVRGVLAEEMHAVSPEWAIAS